MKNSKAMLVSFLSLVAFLVLARIIPHPPNFTPVLGMAIFAPFLFRDLFVAIALPLAAMIVSIWFWAFIALCSGCFYLSLLLPRARIGQKCTHQH